MLPIRKLLLRDLWLLLGTTVLASSVLFYVGARTVLRRQASEQAQERLGHLKQDLEGRFGDAERSSEQLRASWEQGLLDPADPAVLHRTLMGLLGARTGIDSFMLARPDGQTIYAFWNKAARPDPMWMGGLYRRGPQGQEYRDLFRGKELVWDRSAWRPDASDMRFESRPWYQEALSSEGPHWVRPYVFFDASVMGLTCTQALRDPEGRFAGVLAVDLLVEPLAQRAWQVPPTEDSLVVVSDASERAILLPRNPGLEDPAARARAFTQPLGPQLLPPVHALLQAWSKAPENPEPLLVQSGGRQYLGFVERLEGLPGADWTLSLAIPTSEMLSPLNHVALGIAAFGLLALLIGTFWILHVARHFGGPLGELAVAAEGLGQGGTPEIPESAIQEIHTLGEALRRAGQALVEQGQLQDQLQHSQRLETVGTLAGGIAHDVNNQLGAILVQLNLAEESLPAGHPAQERLRRAEDAAQRCAKTTKALLAFSHHARPELSPLDLNGLVQETAALLRRLLGGMVEVQLGLSRELPPVLGDAVQLEQVLMNMAINARDAMPHGGLLSLRTWMDKEGQVVLEVADSGEGIPAEALPHIFEPFFTTKPVGKGTGLGLAMVFGIVKSHRGRIEVHSGPDTGTTFTIHLPPAQATAPRRRSDPPSDPLLRMLQGLRVLVVEDEEALRETLAEALSVAGARVETAPDGELAWEAWSRGEAFDLVLSDHRMPRCTGLELLERLRGSGSGVAFILASGQGLEEAEELAQDPRLRLLAKPFTVSRLIEVIREMEVRALT